MFLVITVGLRYVTALKKVYGLINEVWNEYCRDHIFKVRRELTDIIEYGYSIIYHKKHNAELCHRCFYFCDDFLDCLNNHLSLQI